MTAIRSDMEVALEHAIREAKAPALVIDPSVGRDDVAKLAAHLEGEICAPWEIGEIRDAFDHYREACGADCNGCLSTADVFGWNGDVLDEVAHRLCEYLETQALVRAADGETN